MILSQCQWEYAKGAKSDLIKFGGDFVIKLDHFH